MAHEIVAYRPRPQGGALTRYMPVLNSVAQSAAKGAVSSLLSKVDYGKLGRGARDMYNGFSAKGSQPKSVSFSGPSIMDGMSSAPVAVSNRFVSRKASIRSGAGRKPTVIRHRELISGNIAGSTALKQQLALALNPGNATTFPWLSTQASQYEEYHFRRLMFEYVPIVPTSTQGDIMLIPDYDSSNPPPVTEAQAIDHVDSTIDSVWKPLSVVLSVKDMHALGTRKYVRTQVNTYGDIKTFDVGNLYVFTNNELADGATIGKLFVHYEVELYTPFNGPTVPTAPSQMSVFYNTIAGNLITGTESSIVFESTLFNTLAITQVTSQTFKPPSGVYRVSVVATFGDATNETFNVVLKIRKNGIVAWTGSSAYGVVPGAATFNEAISLSWEAVFACNGGDIIDATATPTGAAGAITTQAGRCQIVFTLV